MPPVLLFNSWHVTLISSSVFVQWQPEAYPLLCETISECALLLCKYTGWPALTSRTMYAILMQIIFCDPVDTIVQNVPRLPCHELKELQFWFHHVYSRYWPAQRSDYCASGKQCKIQSRWKWHLFQYSAECLQGDTDHTSILDGFQISIASEKTRWKKVFILYAL